LHFAELAFWFTLHSRAAAADHAVGQEFEASLASGVLANFRNELSHRTDRNVKRHTSAVEKTKRARAGNTKIQELRSQLAILVAEQKVIFFVFLATFLMIFRLVHPAWFV
jgi:hypothetical protein